MIYLAVMGSERKNKNTNAALDAFLKGISNKGHTYEKVYLKDVEINRCIACDNCSRTGHCIYNDGMGDLYKKIDQCDVFVVASPIYFNTINAHTKTMVDRAQRYWGIKYGYGRDKIDIPKKVGFFIGVGGAKYTHDQFLWAIPVMDMFFKALNAEFRGIYNISETDQIQVSDRPSILKELEEIGENFSDLKEFFIQKVL